MFQHEKREWAKTVLSVDETKPARLPIVDVAIRDIGGPRQKFKLEIEDEITQSLNSLR